MAQHRDRSSASRTSAPAAAASASAAAAGPPGAVRLLWTGGWDSTFRLATLLLKDGRRVQPHYLVEGRGGRQSVAAERSAMQRIRARLAQRNPAAARRLGELVETEIASVPRDPAIARHFALAVRHGFIGGQYEWLARYCAHAGIDDMELAIHRDDKARNLIADLMDESRTRLDPRHAGDPRYELFRFFRFPLFDLTKLRMRALADAAGFAELLELTWFCHEPHEGEPCGTCNPCIYTIEEGLGERLPRAALRRYQLRIMPRVKRWMTSRPQLYWRIRALKHPQSW